MGERIEAGVGARRGWSWAARRVSALVVLGIMATAPACKDEKKPSKTEESDEDDDKPSKKKKAKAGDDEDAPPKPLDVVSIPGFVVPAGGTYQKINMPVGDKVLDFENYTYASATHPRAKLHEDFKRHLEAAGWTVTKDTGPGYVVKKGETEVTVAFGEAGAAETKINVFPPKKAAPAAAPPSVFAGTYSSNFGTVTLTQAKADPSLVTGRYTGGGGGGPGTMRCAAIGKALLCDWREGGSTGQADLVQDASGNLAGTWGMGKTSRGSGTWNMTRTAAGQLE